MKSVVLLVFLYGIFLNIDAQRPGPFRWSSKSYTLKAILTVAAANISEPYQVWVDGDISKSRVDFYGGLDKLYREWDEETQGYKYYKIHPVSQPNHKMAIEEVCNEVEATAPEVKMYALNTYLPVKSWIYVGTENIENVEAKKFIYKYRVSQGQVVYAIWIRIKQPGAITVPVRFVYEFIGEGGKILDNFRHDYTYYDENKPDASILEKPAGMPCTLLPVDFAHEPVDPLVEFIEPDIEYSRVEKAFDRFKMKHNKSYKGEGEHFKRMNVFKDNLRYINSFNRQHKSYTLGVNHLADITKEEMLIFQGTFGKNNHLSEHEGSGDDDDYDDEENSVDNLTGVAANFDWRDYGAVTPVKDQTPICGGCYAFTTAAGVESSAYVARGCQDLEEVSEQAIIDCSWGVANEGNLGCRGGTYEFALYWIKTYGIPMKSEYGPYLAMEGRCHAMTMNKLTKIDNYVHIEKKKRSIKDALRENGPLMASMDTNHLSFLFYASGVYNEANCSSNPNDRSHGVTIVGYGREQGADYWTIKNSFGKDWGEDGYMRLASQKNRCGLKNYVYCVTYEKKESEKCKPLK